MTCQYSVFGDRLGDKLNMRLSDRIALITGGAQGLGKSIALAMAKEGATIVICDINTKTLPDAQSEIESAGARCLAVQCDVSSVDSVADLFRQTVSAFGTLDILVNNAALVQTGARNEEMRAKFYTMMTTPVPKESLGVTKDFSDEEWHKYWGVNVHGVFYCTREALRIMEPKKSGKIINIASIAGTGGFSAFHPAYCATKGAVLAFTRSVAIEVAGANIFVNAIACGGILTPPMESFLASQSDEGRNALHQIIPLGRLGRPEEYASLAVYLASDEHYLVGQTISPNGGMVL
ncbi:SDR family NAD(P)-dependent oxidoreductase [Phyllobacterium lublinensis]|uniref:SDR family NAD(P)-dependent oxidoreductase n=1 Tax=Phyllobacterium lublinensis TaxID=2875708 RepID=UPI001CCAE61E|nr:SDR family oxidoreductase [Phyllobacterium sp. 2063]MBZ9654035.1 SDR family oxidoreductase [Phyllobacterium sp. 2063]